MRWSLLSLSAIVIAAVACEKKDSASLLTSDMSGAVGLAIRKPVETNGFAITAAETTGGQPFFSLVKIDANGNIDPVFNQERPVYFVAVSSSHVIVSGDFYDVATPEDGAIRCYLVTFPRTASGEAVKCISKGAPGLPASIDPISGYSTPPVEPGFVVAEGDVYFSETVQPNPSESTSRLWRWEAGAAENELLLQVAAPLTLIQPYTSPVGSYVCVNDSQPSILCSPYDPPNWADSGADAGSGLDPVGMVLGTSLLVQGSVINLVNGTRIASPVVFGATIPPPPWARVVVGTTAFGLQAIGTGNARRIVRFVPTGDILEIDATTNWERILGAGNYAFVYGSSRLQRLDLRTSVLGSSNLLGQVGLVQVTDVSFSTEGMLRLDGTGSSGLPVIVLLDTSAGTLTVTEQDVPRFQSVTPLQ